MDILPGDAPKTNKQSLQVDHPKMKIMVVMVIYKIK